MAGGFPRDVCLEGVGEGLEFEPQVVAGIAQLLAVPTAGGGVAVCVGERAVSLVKGACVCCIWADLVGSSGGWVGWM